jgi:hypothetical protein
VVAALRRMVDALADASEEDAAPVLRAPAARSGRQRSLEDVPRPPLPPPGRVVVRTCLVGLPDLRAQLAGSRRRLFLL